MTNHQDHNHIEQLRGGNAQAFSFLVEKYQNMVFTMCLRMLNNREEAEDVAQEAFIKCYHSLSKFKGDSKFSTWLYKIVYNTCLDKLRTLKKLPTSELIDDIHEGEVEHLDDALSLMLQDEKTKLVRRAVSSLSKEDQLLIQLFYFEELSLKEIADVAGISMENIKIRLYRGRKKLFHLLKETVEPSIKSI